MSEQAGDGRESRICGDCQACCHCLAITELNKSTFGDCPHQCASGCGIYDRRPGSCRSFKCLWLMGFLAEDQRPDRLGVILVTTQHPEMGKMPMVIEVKPGALRLPNVQQAITRMRQTTAVAVMTQQVRHVLRQLRPPRRQTSRRTQLARMAEQQRPAKVPQDA